VEGFREIIPLETAIGLTVADLIDILYGNPVIQVDELIEGFDLNRHAAEDQHIQWFFEPLRSYGKQQLGEFVRFALGTPITPVGGFKTLNPRITINVIDDVRRLPQSKKCFHQVFLPSYTSEADVRVKLTLAIQNNGSMEG